MKSELDFDPLRYLNRGDPISGSTMGELEFKNIPPFLRALLVTDGTVTRFLEAYLWEPIQVERIFQEEIEIDHDLPWLDVIKGTPILKRQVLLRRGSTGAVYTFAESFICLDRLANNLRSELLFGRLGMGELLRDRRMETYRELLACGRELAGPLSTRMGLGDQEMLLTRSYRIFSRQVPTILISERFPEKLFQAIRSNQ